LAESLNQNYKVPGYNLLECLGQGGFGQVFRAEDTSPFKVSAAIKIISPHPFTDPKYVEQRFLREAEAVRKLNHGGIVRYLNSGFTEDKMIPFLAMDFIEGDTLKSSALRQSYETRVDYMIQALDALEYAHMMGVLHRDIKPSNMLIRKSDEKVVIVDFGLAFLLEGISNEQFSTRYVGSIGYIPPEVIANFNHRERTHDIFSCGITLYEILSGQRPNLQNYESLSLIHADLASLDSIIKQAISPEENRFKTAKEFSDRLRYWLDFAISRNKVGTNKIAELARKSLIAKKNEEERRNKEHSEKLEKRQAIWEEKNAVVISAAKQAFKEMFLALSDLMGDFDFIDVPEAKGEPLALLAFKDRINKIQIIFAQINSFNEPIGSKERDNYGLLGIRQNSNPVRRNAQPTQPVSGFYKPGWVIYTEGNQSQKKIAYGCIGIGQSLEPKLFARNIRSNKKAHSSNGPIILNSFEEICEYVSKAIADALHLDVNS